MHLEGFVQVLYRPQMKDLRRLMDPLVGALQVQHTYISGRGRESLVERGRKEQEFQGAKERMTDGVGAG